MSSTFEGLGTIVSAIISTDSFAITEALDHQAAYVFGAGIVLIGGLLPMFLLRAVPFLDR